MYIKKYKKTYKTLLNDLALCALRALLIKTTCE